MSKDNNGVQSKLKILITFLLPIIAIMVPIAIYMSQLKDKNLTYEVVSYSLVNLSYTISDEIEIRFLGKKVTDLSVMNIEIKNAGDMPIRKEDFEKNMAIDFGEEAEILKSSITHKFPSNLAITAINKGNSMKVSPLLLNPGDYFSIEVIVSKTTSDPKFDARIAGISMPTKISQKQYFGSYLSNRLLVFIICMLLILYSFSSILFFASLKLFSRKQKTLWSTPIALLAFLSAISSMQLTVKYRLKDLSSFFTLESLLYGIVIALGGLLGYSLIYKFKASQKNEDNSDKNIYTQQSD